MTNREKQTEEILNVACRGGSIAMDRYNNKICSCGDIECENCAFYDSHANCSIKVKIWSESEYVEKPKISKRDRGFLECIKESYRYMARDMDGEVYVYQNRPHKKIDEWGNGEEVQHISCFKVDFLMVKWEDEEPWLIEDLKKLEVVEEYENN